MFNSGQFLPYFSGGDDLRIIPHCPVCDSPYQNLKTKILEEKDDGYLVYIKCQKCLNSVVSFITNSANGVNSISLITDLSTADIIKFKDSEGVTSDDVIEIHQLLKSDNNLIEKLSNS